MKVNTMLRFEILFKPGYFKVCLCLVRLAQTTFSNFFWPAQVQLLYEAGRKESSGTGLGVHAKKKKFLTLWRLMIIIQEFSIHPHFKHMANSCIIIIISTSMGL